MPKDSTGKTILVGDVIRFRGKEYTIKEFNPKKGIYDTCSIEFNEPQHVTEVADEISVDFIRRPAHQ